MHELFFLSPLEFTAAKKRLRDFCRGVTARKGAEFEDTSNGLGTEVQSSNHLFECCLLAGYVNAAIGR